MFQLHYINMWFLHVGHEKSNKFMNVACRLEDASVVSEFLQHLETLKHKQFNISLTIPCTTVVVKDCM